MRRRRKMSALGILGGTVLLMVAAMSAPATAEVIKGPCTGSGTFSNGLTITESTPLSVDNVVPTGDTKVDYTGDTHLPPVDEEEAFSGHVSVRLPAGGSFVVAEWPEPPGETKLTSKTDSYEYTIPSWVPKGTGGLEVTAYHTQRGQICEVAVVVSLDGSPGAAAAAGTGATILFGAGVAGAGIRKRVA